MATEPNEFNGKTVEEAVAEGLRALNLTAEQVEVEIVHKGSRGIFGLGSEPAVVRLHARMAPPTPSLTGAPTIGAPAHPADAYEAEVEDEGEDVTDTEREESIEQAPAPLSDEDSHPVADEEVEMIASQLLNETVELMGFQATVATTWRGGNDELSEHSDRYLLLNVQGDELGALIGRRGEALDNLQYLLRLMVNQRLRRWRNIVVDVEGYKERRLNQLKQLAMRTATQVAGTGRAVSLEPMPPNERRIIHLTLRDHPDVYTESTGEGDRRKVHILAKSH
jgi:spoIIIJ-associated protein